MQFVKNLNEMVKLKINVFMENKWKFRLGVIFCLMGMAILLSSVLSGKYLPGGLALLALGLILISDSRK